MAVSAHANRHGSRHATAWGVATFLFAGIIVPFYFVRYWLRNAGRRAWRNSGCAAGITLEAVLRRPRSPTYVLVRGLPASLHRSLQRARRRALFRETS